MSRRTALGARLLAAVTRAEARAYGLRERHVDVGDATLSVLEGGPADGPAVVLLHGYSADRVVWMRFAGTCCETTASWCPTSPATARPDSATGTGYSAPAQASAGRRCHGPPRHRPRARRRQLDGRLRGRHPGPGPPRPRRVTAAQRCGGRGLTGAERGRAGDPPGRQPVPARRRGRLPGVLRDDDGPAALRSGLRPGGPRRGLRRPPRPARGDLRGTSTAWPRWTSGSARSPRRRSSCGASRTGSSTPAPLGCGAAGSPAHARSATPRPGTCRCSRCRGAARPTTAPSWPGSAPRPPPHPSPRAPGPGQWDGDAHPDLDTRCGAAGHRQGLVHASDHERPGSVVALGHDGLDELHGAVGVVSTSRRRLARGPRDRGRPRSRPGRGRVGWGAGGCLITGLLGSTPPLSPHR